MKPQRIQLSRKKGFNLQASSLALNGLPAVNCARPGKWGNPWKAGTWSSTFQRTMTTEDAVARYRAILTTEQGGWPMKRRAQLEELRGKNLACFCKPSEPCHCDVLLEIANGEKL